MIAVMKDSEVAWPKIRMYEMIVCNTGQGHIINLWTPVSLVSAPTLPESCVYFQWMLTVSSIFSLAVVLLDFVRCFEAAKAALRATLTHSLYRSAPSLLLPNSARRSSSC